jgi:uncharacterized protein
MKTPLTFLLSLTFLFLFGGSVYGYDFQDGLDAYNRKDYKSAFLLYSLAAEKRNANAQYYMGTMYYQGYGVLQDYKKAVKWYRLSAKQGYVNAQIILGTMYYQGYGVLQDLAIAHMWFNLCGSGGDEDCVTYRKIIEKQMSPSQIEKAQEMARNWKPTKK